MSTACTCYLQCFRNSYNILLERLDTKLDDMGSNIEKLAKDFPLGYSHSGSASDIPLNPAHEDWEHINFWYKKTWLSVKGGNDRPSDIKSSISALFLEDERGCTVSREVREAVYQDARGFMTDKASKPETRRELHSQSKLGFRIREEFRKTLEEKYPWLRLCEGHWKAPQIWQNVWSSWVTDWTKNHPDEPLPPSHTGSPGSVGKKHSITDEEDHPGPSKKLKGKEVEREYVPTPKPYSSRPKPRKTSGKAARVSVRRFVFISHALTENL